MAPPSAWAQRLREFLPQFAGGDAALAPLRDRWSVLLHGSTAAGVDDAASDLDLWALVPAAALDGHDRASASRFHAFTLNGKRGHLNVEAEEGFRDRLARCDMPLLAELRRAHVLEDGLGAAGKLVAAARLPMPEPVRQAWFRFHYGEMRGWWRTAENTDARDDAMARLLTVPHVIEEGLRAAMIVDGEPYPYQKWLPAWAAATPTGSLLTSARERILDALEEGALRGGEAWAALSAALLDVRRLLIDRAHEEGIEGDWLERWWLDIDGARAAVAAARWPTAPG